MRAGNRVPWSASKSGALARNRTPPLIPSCWNRRQVGTLQTRVPLLILGVPFSDRAPQPRTACSSKFRGRPGPEAGHVPDVASPSSGPVGAALQREKYLRYLQASRTSLTSGVRSDEQRGRSKLQMIRRPGAKVHARHHVHQLPLVSWVPCCALQTTRCGHPNQGTDPHLSPSSSLESPFTWTARLHI